jgi:hypothetical protein
MKETVRISCLFSFALRVYARGGIIVLKEVVAMKEIANKRYIALNNHLILCVVLFVVFIFISFFSFVDREIFGGVFFSLLTLLPIMVFLLSPIYYVFSSKEIIIVYCLGKKECIVWQDVRSITLYGSWLLRVGGLPTYSFAYPQREKMPFYMNGEIAKTIKTKKLIKMYWDKEIF